MRLPRWLDTFIYLALALFLIWDSGRRLVEWLTTGQLRLWSLFGDADRYASFSQEPIYFMFGLFTMSAMTVAALIAIIVLYDED